MRKVAFASLGGVIAWGFVLIVLLMSWGKWKLSYFTAPGPLCFFGGGILIMVGITMKKFSHRPAPVMLCIFLGGVLLGWGMLKILHIA